MNTEERIRRLERENTWMRRVGAVALAVAAGVLLMGQGKAEKLPDLEVRSLTVKDEKGGVRVKLGTDIDGTAYLGLHDKAGRDRLVLRTAANGNPHLRLADQAGKRRVVLRTFLDGSAVLALGRLFLRTTADGSPSIKLADQRSRIRASLGTDDDGSPTLEFRDAENKLIWQAPR